VSMSDDLGPDVDTTSEGGDLAIRRSTDAYLQAVVDAGTGVSAEHIRHAVPATGDLIVAHALLDGLDPGVGVVDVGAHWGVSTFLFASHPSVSQVVCVPRPDGAATERATDVDGLLKTVLARAPQILEKVCVPGAGGGRQGSRRSSLRPDLATVPSGESERWIAFVDGHGDHDAVTDDLDWLTSARPDALVLIDNCRRDAGPFVQWGIGQFLTKSGDGVYRFHLLADLSFGLAGSNLGVLYRGPADGPLPHPLERMVEGLGRRLDPMMQLEREQELIAQVQKFRRLARQERHRLEKIRASTTWRVTAPIRSVSSKGLPKRTATWASMTLRGTRRR